jgi:hypothetical protein
MAVPPWSNGRGNMNDSNPSMAAAPSPATQALAADTPTRPISDAAYAAYPNPLQHRVQRMSSSIYLPAQEDLATVLAVTLKEQYDNRLGQPSNTFDALANVLAAQLHITFGPGRSPHQLIPAPSTNHDGRSDVDSDVSWASGEESGIQGDYFKRLECDIGQLSKESGDHVLTVPLTRGARKLVHYLARKNHCSHTTLEDGRIFISADAIEPSYNPGNRRRSSSWSRRTPKVGYYVVPNAVTIQNFPADITLADIKERFETLGISSPNCLRPAENVTCGLIEAEFDNAEDVADFVQELQGKPLRQGEIALRIGYLRRPVSRRVEADLSRLGRVDGAAIVDSMAATAASSQDPTICADHIQPEMNLDAGVYAHTGGGKLPAVDSFPSFDSPSFNIDPTLLAPRSLPSFSCQAPTFYEQTDAGPSTYNPQHLIPPPATRKRPNGDPFGDDGSSNEDLSGTDESATSGSRRVRHPRIPNGWPCGHGSCGKSFDSYGERNKHRRNHLPNEQRPFPCPHCNRAFINAKDLRRHLQKGHKVDAATAEQLSKVEQSRAPPPPDAGAPHLGAPMLQIPDDDLSTFAASSPYNQGMHTPFGGSQDQSPGGLVDAEQYPSLFPDFHM